MTLTEGVTTTWAESIEDVRAAVSDLADWSTVWKNYDTTPSTIGDAFALQVPTGEYLKYRVSDGGYNSHTLEVTLGEEIDETTGTWNTLYSNSPGQPDDGYTGEIGPATGSMDPSDEVTYSLKVDNSDGFIWYVQRNMDENDSDMALGCSVIDKSWDYSLAAANEAEVVLCHTGAISDSGTSHEYDSLCWMSGNSPAEPENTMIANGQPNADGNFDNYPLMIPSVIASPVFDQTIIGTTDLWIWNTSNATHGDTIQDADGNDLYKIQNAADAAIPLGIRIE